MTAYLLRRLLVAPLVLLLLAMVSFGMMRAAPGGPFGGEKRIDPETEAALNAYYHLDRPLPLQFLSWLGDAVRGDLGPSFVQRGTSVNEIIGRYLPVSLWLGLLGLLVALGLGIPLGVLGAVRQGGPLDHGGQMLASLLVSVPTFVIGPLLALCFGLWLRWLPVAEYHGPWAISYLVLPAVTLAAPFIGRIARLVRAGLLDVLRLDHVRTATAKGAPQWRAVWLHALPLGLVPLVGFLGPAIAFLLTGSLVVEQVFQIPGLGREFVVAATNRDYTLVMGTVLVYGTLVVACNLAADLLLASIDPRARQGLR